MTLQQAIQNYIAVAELDLVLSNTLSEENGVWKLVHMTLHLDGTVDVKQGTAEGYGKTVTWGEPQVVDIATLPDDAQQRLVDTIATKIKEIETMNASDVVVRTQFQVNGLNVTL